MRIAYLSTATIPSRTANSVHIMKMCAALVRRGHSVTLFAPQAPSEPRLAPDTVFDYYSVPSNFRIIRLYKPKGALGGYLYALQLMLVLLVKQVDLIYSRNLLCSIFSAFTGRPQVLEIHQPIASSSRFQRRGFDRLIRKKSFCRLVVITEQLKHIYMTEFGVPGEKLIVAADGADLPAKGILHDTFSSKYLQVGYLGHLYAGRGIELIIDVARQCPWAMFHIVGGNPTDIKRVREMVGGDNNIKIHGFIAPGEAEKFRLGMDILLAPYQEKVGLETGAMTTEKWMSPLKVFEYMASGKAMVVSDIPVLREVLINGQNCILCKPADQRDWVQALKRLDYDPALRDYLGRNALNDIRYKYSWDQRVRRLLAKWTV